MENQPHQHFWYQTEQGTKCMICILQDMIRALKLFQNTFSTFPPPFVTLPLEDPRAEETDEDEEEEEDV